MSIAMARISRAESQARTRALLLEAGNELFAAHGYHSVSVEAIAERAGFTRGAFYANFADKADLFMTALEELNQEEFDVLKSELRPSERNIEVFVRSVERTFAGSELLGQALAEFRASVASTPEYAARLSARYQAVREQVGRLVLEIAEELGTALTVPADDFAVAAMALMDGFVLHRQMDGGTMSPELLARSLEMLWAGATTAGDTDARMPGPARRSAARTEEGTGP